MTKVCILNSTTNVVENVVEVDDINNIPSFVAQEGQIIATNHSGNIGDTWNGSSYETPIDENMPSDEELKQAETDKETKKQSAKSKLEALGLTTEEIKEAFGI